MRMLRTRRAELRNWMVVARDEDRAAGLGFGDRRGELSFQVLN